MVGEHFWTGYFYIYNAANVVGVMTLEEDKKINCCCVKIVQTGLFFWS